MQANDVLHGAGKESERIGVAQIALLGERQLADVFQRSYLLRREPALVHARAEELDLLPRARNHGLQALQLQLAQQLDRRVIRRIGWMAVGDARFQSGIHFFRSMARPMENARRFASCSFSGRLRPIAAFHASTENGK